MRIDLVVPNQETYGREAVAACGQLEKMGYEGLWFTDHVVGYEAYKPVYGAYWLEILTAMTHAAAITDTVRIGSGVLVLPYRDALLTAKMLASIDQLSNGRVDLGIGTGWYKPEFIALGRLAYFADRGKVTNETLDVMLHCWAAQGEEPVEFHGEFSDFRGLQFQPVPVQQPRIPIWVGARGTAKGPTARAAKYADVWHPTGIAPGELAEGSDRINEAAGREVPVSARIQRAGGPLEAFVETVHQYEEAGCVQVAIDLRSKSLGDYLDTAAALIEALRG
jgi:probable F420-dependent oxidoreductase